MAASKRREHGVRAVATGLLIVTLWYLSPAVTPAAAPRLRYVAIVTRHGVRAPTWTADRLNEWSSEPWPSFGVAPGELTQHGRLLMTLLGNYYRQWLSREGLLTNGCRSASRVYIWADTDQRTIETAHALAESLLPGCAPAVHAHTGDGEDPLFDPIAAGAVHPDGAALATDLRGRLAAQQQTLARDLEKLDALQRVLTGGGHAAHALAEHGSAIDVAAAANGVDLSGPLSTASTMSENLLLEYTNGFSGRDLGWGRLPNEATLLELLALHADYADLTRRTPAIARARSSNLLAHVRASIAQAVHDSPANGAFGTPDDAVLIISGHDTNLSNLSGMLNLSWHLQGYQADDTPPGGALLFTVWDLQDGREPVVRLTYLAQTLAQMHAATPLTLDRRPASADVQLPACRAAARGGGCPWTDFDRIVAQAIEPSFVVR